VISLRFYLRSPATCAIGFSGVPLRAAFLNLLHSFNADLSSRVHGEEGLRAYSLDPFRCDPRFQTQFMQGEEYDFGVNLFRPRQFQGMMRSIAMRRDCELRILHHEFSLRRVDMEQVPIESLTEKWLKEMPQDTNGRVRMRFRFITPTQLSSFGSDRAYLLPTPEKVFSGLLRVWKTLERSTTLLLTSAYRDWITENIYVSWHRLRTVKVSLGRRRTLLGFVGEVEYSMETSESSMANLTYCLARFAELCNVGKNRSAGFGKVLIDTPNQDPDEHTKWRGKDVLLAG
jgi:CRISPR-associated endoribonuclease Cas6